MPRFKGKIRENLKYDYIMRKDLKRISRWQRRGNCVSSPPLQPLVVLLLYVRP